MASAADLKLLHRQQQTRLGASIESGTRIMKLLVPLCFPKFVSERAEGFTNFGHGALVSDRRYPMRNRIITSTCAKCLRHRVIEKPDPCGPGLSSSAREPTITFQRGTAADLSVAIWEDGQPIAGSNNFNMPSDPSPNNLEARMPAMRGSQAAVCSARFARYFPAPVRQACRVVHSLRGCR
jgi:hypothetical protein